MTNVRLITGFEHQPNPDVDMYIVDILTTALRHARAGKMTGLAITYTFPGDGYMFQYHNSNCLDSQMVGLLEMLKQDVMAEAMENQAFVKHSELHDDE